MKTAMKTLGLAGVLLIVAVIPVEARQTDSRWAPWLGCWQLVDETVRQVGSADTGRANAAETRVCVEQIKEASGVRLRTLIDNQPVLEQTIVANGAEHPVDEADCRGDQSADWSRTGERLFSRAALLCTNEGPRKVSGLATVIDGTWIDIQAIEIAGREHIRVRRFRRSANQIGGDAEAQRAVSIAPRVGAARFTLDDVKEASARLSPRVVEAALVETKASFDLNSRALIALDEAAVPDSVIDLMVALSFPTRFIVDRTRPAASTSIGPGVMDPLSVAPYDTFWASSYAPYYFSPFGYAYWAGYGVPFYPVTGFVTFDHVEPARAESTGSARLVNGMGYTQVRSRAPEPAQSSGNGAGGNGGNDSSGAAGTRSTSSSGSDGSAAGASSGGYSGGGSSTDTGRTAEPR
jgi:hypothetical protein